MAKDLKAIQAELEKATGVTFSKGDDEQDYLRRIVRKTSALDDKEWKALSDAAQDWFNEQAEAINEAKQAKKEPVLKGFGKPDDEDDEKPARRRAAASDDADEYVPKVGAEVTVTMSDGEMFTGKVTELDEKYVTLETKDGEEACRRKNVKSIVPAKSKSAAKDEDDEKPAEAKVGDTVKVETEDETYKGVITEMDEKYVTLEIDGEEESIKRRLVKSIKVISAGKGKPAKDEDDERPARGRASTKDEDDDKPARGRRSSSSKDEDDGKTTRQRAARGEESDVSKAWRLCAENLDADFAKIQKLVAKAGLEVKENTLNIKFNDVHRHYELFKELGLIKA